MAIYVEVDGERCELSTELLKSSAAATDVVNHISKTLGCSKADARKAAGLTTSSPPPSRKKEG